MRTHYYIIVAAMAFAACADNDDLKVLCDNNEPMELCCDIQQDYTTRVSGGSFACGDAIGVYVVDYKDGQPVELQASGNHATNIKTTYDGEAWSSDVTLYWSDKTTFVDAYSYCPYAEQIDDVAAYGFSVQHRQDKDGGYEASDFLWAKATNVMPLKTINLLHQHTMAAVQVSLVEGDGFVAGEWVATEKAVTVTGVALDACIDLRTGVVTPNGEATGGIIPYRQDGDWRCVVVPQSVASGETLIQITVDGELYNFTRTEDMVYHAGKQHKFGIQVTKRDKGDYQFSLLTEAVTPWEADGISHNGEAQAYITVNVPKAGELKAAIDALGLNYKSIQSLKIVGTMDEADFLFINEYLPFLAAINLKDVRTERCHIHGNDYTQERCVIPDYAFCFKMNGYYDRLEHLASLKHVVLPDHLEEIGQMAFRGTCLSQDIVLPEGLTHIGDRAFDNSDLNGVYGWGSDGIWYRNNITRVSLPSTVEYIGKQAFAGCPLRQELELPEGLTHIGARAFSECTNITGSIHIPSGIKTVPDKAFYGMTSLSGTLEVPATVEEVGIGAFARTGFTSLVLNEGLKTIGSAAFSGVWVGYESQVGGNDSELYPFGGDLTVPRSVERIGMKAFSGTAFQHISLPDNFEELPLELFCASELIDTFYVPSRVNYLAPRVFGYCHRLTAVVLPKGLLNIDSECFRCCYSLDYIQCLSETPPTLLGYDHFVGVAKDNFTLVVPKGCVDAYRNAPGWSEFKRISEYRNFVCRPQTARLLNKANTREVILNADGAWTVTHTPSWVHVSKTEGVQKTQLTITIDALGSGAGNRNDSIVFCLNGTDHTTCYKIEQFDSENDEDTSIALQQATKGKGINLVFLGDGYDAKDIAEGGYLDDMKQSVEYFFDVEPYKTYRDYFNVYTVFAMSYESGIGTLNTKRDVKFNTYVGSGKERMKCDFDKVLYYAIDNTAVEEADMGGLTCVVIPNTTAYDGVTMMSPSGAAVALCPKSTSDYPYDARGLVQHEAGGHGFGKMADEYIYHAAWIQTCGCPCCEHVPGLEAMHAMGWGWNMSLVGKYNDVPWGHLIGDNRFNDIVDVYEGGYFHSRGAFRSEQNSCMNNNVPYYSTWSRELIVRRIKKLSGETFDFEDFVHNDSREWGRDFTRGTRATQPVPWMKPRHAQAPVIMKRNPVRPKRK